MATMPGSRRRIGARRWAAWTAVAGVLALAGTGPGEALAFRNVKEGAKAPDFTLSSTEGKTLALSSLQGKAVVLALVRQGQDRSADVLADLSRLDPSLGGETAVVAVVVNPADGDAAAWASQGGAKFPVLLDTSAEVYGLYGVVVTPSTGVLAPDGTFRGEVGSHTASYRRQVEHLIKVALGLAEQGEPLEEAASGPAKPEERKAAERELEKARLLLQRKMTDKALAAARQAVQSDPSYVEAHVVLGNLLLETSEEGAGEALGHFEKALELSPKDVDARAGTARVKSIQGDHEEAARILEGAALLNPKPEKLYYELGRVYERAGQFEKAVGAYRKALERLLEGG
ncbi:MAG: tetratricopeptide repeat protein [Thermodesulfobacteriota bacterium]